MRAFGIALAIAVVLPAADRTNVPPSPLPARVRANDNRRPAGTLRNDTLTLRLSVGIARWYPEADGGHWVDVAAFAEEGGPPEIPAPLIRVPTATTIVATIRNTLPDSTIFVQGLMPRPAVAADTIPLPIPPGESRTVTFTVGAPGTYLYRARTAGTTIVQLRERDQLAGAFIVDSAGTPPPPDRVFVINIWSDSQPPHIRRRALTINGRSWPHTERIAAAVGDSLRWRVINASQRAHPMHLHGFYFRVEARGDWLANPPSDPAAPRLVVTQELRPNQTMSLLWNVERPGNWLFHCHVGFHVVPQARLSPEPPAGHDWHDVDPAKHMSGLIVGVTVSGAESPALGGPARRLTLYVNAGKPRGLAGRAMSYVLQQGAAPPAPDSTELPGSALVLTQGQPTEITVVNRLTEPTSVHWHGIELESYSDGVAGWSGSGSRRAPVIASRDSFVARLTLPRAGTFMYHTHLNDLEQLTAGLYGAIVVLPPGERYDPTRDHLYVVGWDGEQTPPRLLVNGDSTAPPLELTAGVPHRLRLVNIGAAQFATFVLRHAAAGDTSLVPWRALAKDGADMPLTRPVARPARVQVGETFDFEVMPEAGHEYGLTIRSGAPLATRVYRQRIVARH